MTTSKPKETEDESKEEKGKQEGKAQVEIMDIDDMIDLTFD